MTESLVLKHFRPKTLQLNINAVKVIIMCEFLNCNFEKIEKCRLKN